MKCTAPVWRTSYRVDLSDDRGGLSFRAPAHELLAVLADRLTGDAPRWLRLAAERAEPEATA